MIPRRPSIRTTAPRLTAMGRFRRGPRMGRLRALDHRLLRRVVRQRHPATTSLLRVLCRLYEPDRLGIILVCLLYPAGNCRAWAIRGLIAMACTTIAVVSVKRLVRRSRPDNEMRAQLPPDRFSFPSGHAAAAFAFALSGFALFPGLVPPLLLLASLVGYARVYLGVHFPLDVGVGAGLGLVIGSCVALF